ncbi:MAG: DUF2752 domain-containing protein [Planctomycetes bacterium]|nr:DUF2752 domain-containing protein [Planctomycetota bacterium]
MLRSMIGTVPTAAAVPVAMQDRLARGERAAMALVTLACAVLLGIAAWLQPAAAGIGTHRQLGLPSCSWPSTMNIPCPSCGMTTAFALAADGRLIDAFHAQPLGLLLAIGTAALAIASAHSAATGARTVGILWGMVGSKAWWALGAFAVAAWGYKILVMRGVL